MIRVTGSSALDRPAAIVALDRPDRIPGAKLAPKETTLSPTSRNGIVRLGSYFLMSAASLLVVPLMTGRRPVAFSCPYISRSFAEMYGLE